MSLAHDLAIRNRVEACRQISQQGDLAISGRSLETLCFTGEITQNNASAFVRSIRRVAPKYIVVNSSGGSAIGALNIAEELIGKDVTIIVDKICASSCANYLFVAAEKKIVLHDALVIWHGGPSRQNIPDYSIIEDVEYKNKAIAVWNTISDRTSSLFTILRIKPSFVFQNPNRCRANAGEAWTVHPRLLETQFKIHGLSYEWFPRNQSEINSHNWSSRVDIVETLACE